MLPRLTFGDILLLEQGSFVRVGLVAVTGISFWLASVTELFGRANADRLAGVTTAELFFCWGR